MRQTTLLGGAAIAALATILLVPALGQRAATPAPPATGTGSTTFNPATLPEQQIGEKFTVNAEDLPPPKTGPVVASRSLIVPYQDQKPRAPDGFSATAFAIGLEHPGRLLVLPNGDVILAGKPWQTFVTERILRPLGMTRTTFTVEDMLATPEPAVPY